MNNGKKKHFYDYSLVIIIIFLIVFGLVMIYSASSYSAQLKMGDAGYYMKQQGSKAAIGFALMIIISLVDYRKWLRFAPALYAGSYVLMILTMIIGKEINGKKRWLAIGPISFQPTEVVKIAIILFMAVYIANMGREINTWKGIAKVFAFDVPLAALVAENNLSSGIIILGIAAITIFVTSDNKAYSYTSAGLVLFTCIFLRQIGELVVKISLFKPYQLSRIMVWLDPSAHPLDGGYQVLQGLYAIGSGGLTGKGLGNSIQKLGFVPEAQNDMIFSIICEELGLFGAISLIMVFLFLIYRLIVIANSAPDLYGSIICIGVAAHIALQVFLNIAVVSNLIPNTGITLPFISYGGTSVMILLGEMGLVLGVSRQIRLDNQVTP